MIIIKKVSCLGIKNAQLFDIEITYIEDGKLCVRKTTAAEVLRLLKEAETKHPLNRGAGVGGEELPPRQL